MLLVLFIYTDYSLELGKGWFLSANYNPTTDLEKRASINLLFDTNYPESLVLLKRSSNLVVKIKK